MPKRRNTDFQDSRAEQEMPRRAPSLGGPAHLPPAISSQGRLRGSDVLSLQRSAGNRAVGSLLTHPIAVQRDKADDRKDRYHSLEGDMGDYAKRTGKEKRDFTDTALETTMVARALSLPRGTDGELSAEAIDIMNQKTQDDAKVTLLDKYAKFGVKDKRSGFFKDKKLKKYLAGNERNALSGESRYPEMANIVDSSSKEDVDVKANVDVGGVTMAVTYNKSDRNYAARLNLLTVAVGKVTGAGFTVPSLNVQIPKWSREVTINSDCTISVGVTTSAAQYLAPNLMHLGAGGLSNPQEGTRKNPTTGLDEPNFMSAQVDLSGVGTVVHELGHAVHYALSPSKFHNLHFTTFKGQNPQTTAAKVSGYATNPREFVAEVFTGVIYGKTFSKDVIEMYNAFGGPMTNSLRAQLI